MSFSVLDANGNLKTNALGDPVTIAHGGTGQTTAGPAQAALNAEFTTTTTGNIDDLDFSNASIIRMNNASLATIRGLKAGTAGQQVTLVSIGAGQVDLSNQDAGSSAANRLINTVTSISTSLAAGAGKAIYQYDATTARWRLIHHEQGGVVSFTTTWTATGSNPAIGNGSIVSSFELTGARITAQVTITMGSTTTFGTGAWRFSSIANKVGDEMRVALAADTGTLDYLAYTQFVSASAYRVGVISSGSETSATVPFTWGDTDILLAYSAYTIS